MKKENGDVSSVPDTLQVGKYGKPGDLDRLIRQTTKESPAHDKVTEMAREVVKFWAPIMTLDGWKFKVNGMKHGDIVSDGSTCVGAVQSEHGTREAHIAISEDYDYDHPMALEGGVENVVRHELGHVVLNELGYFEVSEILLGNSKKVVKESWLKTFAESVLDRMAVMVGKAYEKGVEDGRSNYREDE